MQFSARTGALTGKLFPSGSLVDTIKMDDGTTIDVTITDMVNPCVFFKAADFGLGLTGLELPNPDWSLKGPPGATSIMSWVSGSVSRSVWRTAKRAALRRSGTRRRTALRAHRCQAGPGGRRIWPVRNGSHVVGEFIPRRRAASCSVSRPKFRGVGEVRSLS
jgi:hypothetical protein